MAFDFGTANENQKQAIQATDGPVLIIAGPGTGKTFTLVKRAVYLITEKHVKPENIMIATFTEKAAKEIITRITNELLALEICVNVSELYIGTLHSICLRLIKENLEHTRLKKNYRLLDDFEQKYFVFQKIKEFDEIPNIDLFYGDTRSSWSKAQSLIYYINAVSEELVAVEDLAKHPSIEVRTLGKVIEKYNGLLDEENALDFSSIQNIAYHLLINKSEVCQKIQTEIKYIMIDEYQDTNYVQEQFVFLVGNRHHNICVVGDDDQGLYRFRGATIRNILEFPTRFPDCKKITLFENYRSEKDIVNFYNEWMTETSGQGYSFEWDNFRFDKRIVPAKKNFVEGVPTVLKVGASEDEAWRSNVLDFINKLKASGKLEDYNQIAFLFRSVKHERIKALADFLEQNGVPVYSPRSDVFFDREEIQLTIGAMIAYFPDYVKRLNTGAMRATPELQRYYVECVKSFYKYLKTNGNEDLKKFIQFRARDHAVPQGNFDYAFTGLLYQILQFEPFKTWMGLDVSGVTDTRPLRNLAIFSNLTARYEYLHRVTIFTRIEINRTVDYFFNVFLRFLMDGGIDEYEDDAEYAPSGCVSFMTIHQSKGLEFPIVIVGSLYATPKDQNSEIIEILERDVYHRKPYEPYGRVKFYDFWRLYYTAFSRAQNLLVLSAREQRGHGAEPSKYFRQIYETVPYYFDPNIDYSHYAFDRIKEVNIKQSYSFTSHIALYENCSLQYKIFKEVGFAPVRTGATLFGTLVHQTIEDIHRAVLRNEKETITEANIETWFENNYAHLSKKEHTFLAEPTRNAALRQVKKYADKESGDWERVIDAEVEISHVEPDYILSGKIDLLRGEGNTVEIVDFKAEKKPDMEKDRESIARYYRQLQLYSFIVEQRFGLSVSKMYLYYTGETDGKPTIDFDNRASDMAKAIMAVDKTVRKIQCKDFSGRSSNEKMCKNCDLRYFCGRI